MRPAPGRDVERVYAVVQVILSAINYDDHATGESSSEREMVVEDRLASLDASTASSLYWKMISLSNSVNVHTHRYRNTTYP